MELAIVAMKKTMIFYLVFGIGILFVLGLCFVFSTNDYSKKSSVHVYAIAIFIVLVIYILTSFVPYLRDYISNDIVEQRAIYTNIIGEESKSASGAMGIYSVTLEFDGQTKKLTTVPFQKEVFIQGTYDVNAYFTSLSNRLLYIEIISKYE